VSFNSKFNTGGMKSLFLITSVDLDIILRAAMSATSLNDEVVWILVNPVATREEIDFRLIFQKPQQKEASGGTNNEVSTCMGLGLRAPQDY